MLGVPGLLLAKLYTNLTHLPDKDKFFTSPHVVGGGVRRAACFNTNRKVYSQMPLRGSYFQS